MNALLEHFPLKDHQAYSIPIKKNQAVIDVIPDTTVALEQISSAETPEARSREMLEWIKSIATPVGLSDYAVSRESIYSPDE